MQKHKIVVLAVIALLVVTIGLSAQESDLIATVNGTQITKAEFYETMEQEVGQFVLQQMIIEELIRQKQAELNVVITDEEFDKVYNQILQQLGGPQGLQQFLAQNRVSEAQLIEQIRSNLLLSKLAQAEVSVTDEEIQEWFANNKESLDTGEQVEASHILVETEEEANSLLEQLKDGGDFAELAKAHSTDPGSKDNGGKLGFFEQGTMVKPFEEKAFSLQVGEYGLAETDYGWHVILVTGKEEAKEAVLSDWYDDIRDELSAQKALAPSAYVEKLQKDANIEIFEERYQR